jgi:hypothetical protein
MKSGIQYPGLSKEKGMHCLHWQGEHESRAHKEDSTRKFLAGTHYLGLSEKWNTQPTK